MPLAPFGISASADLGLGDMLGRQTQDELEDERKKRLLGLSPATKNSVAAQQLFGFGPTGIGSAAGISLGLGNGRR